jgi:hypothetical protein
VVSKSLGFPLFEGVFARIPCTHKISSSLHCMRTALFKKNWQTFLTFQLLGTSVIILVLILSRISSSHCSIFGLQCSHQITQISGCHAARLCACRFTYYNIRYL